MALVVDDLTSSRILVLAQAADKIADNPLADLALGGLADHYINLADAAAQLDDLALIHSFDNSTEAQQKQSFADIQIKLATAINELKVTILEKFAHLGASNGLSAAQLSLCSRLQKQHIAGLKSTTEAAGHIAARKRATQDWSAFLKSLTVNHAGNEIPLAKLATSLTNPDRAVRQGTYATLCTAFTQHRESFTSLLSRICMSNNAAAAASGFPDPLSMRVTEASLSGDVVGIYVQTVAAAFPTTTHPFYVEKAAKLKLPKLEVYDTSVTEIVPIPFTPTAELAAKIWLKSLAKISPELQALGEQALADGRMKIGEYPRSQTLALSASEGPVAFVSFKPSIDGIRAVGHEGGHLLHLLMAQAKGHPANYRPDNLVAETIALFFEGIILDTLAEQQPDLTPAITAGRKQRDIVSICTTTSFMEFEIAAHNLARQGELVPDAIEDLWRDLATKRFGAAVISRPENHGLGWATIPQIMQEPFCSYSYGMGQIAAHAITAAIRQDENQINTIQTIMAEGENLTYEEVVQKFVGLNGDLQKFFAAGVANLATQYSSVTSFPATNPAARLYHAYER